MADELRAVVRAKIPRGTVHRDPPASTSMTRWEWIDPAASVARHSRVNSSITVRHFSGWPWAQSSTAKSEARSGWGRCPASDAQSPRAGAAATIPPGATAGGSDADS